ncbi:hypothetical protein ACQRIT_005137 [Beauveria bassiana]
MELDVPFSSPKFIQSLYGLNEDILAGWTLRVLNGLKCRLVVGENGAPARSGACLLDVESNLQSQDQSTELRCVYRGYVRGAHVLRSFLADAVELEIRCDRSCANVAINAATVSIDTDHPWLHGVMFFNGFCG